MGSRPIRCAIAVGPAAQMGDFYVGQFGQILGQVKSDWASSDWVRSGWSDTGQFRRDPVRCMMVPDQGNGIGSKRDSEPLFSYICAVRERKKASTPMGLSFLSCGVSFGLVGSSASKQLEYHAELSA